MFYFNKNGSKASIDLSNISGYGYAKTTDATNSTYIASTTAIGTWYSTGYWIPGSGYSIFAVPRGTNAIKRIRFYIHQGQWWIHEVEFANKFSGKVHIKAQLISNGAGASGSYTTKVDADGAALSNVICAYMGSSGIPSYTGLGIGGYTLTRYKITITATDTSGNVHEVNFPLIYCESCKDTVGNSAYRYVIYNPITATGYDPVNRTSSVLNSEYSYSYSNESTVTTLNLENTAFKWADYYA